MGRKLPKNTTKRKRAEKRIAKLEKQGRMVNGMVIPKGSIPANPEDQAEPNSLSAKYFYRDIAYKCRGCGKNFVWTDEQQKRYFEDQKGNIHNVPTWCTPCHKKRLK